MSASSEGEDTYSLLYAYSISAELLSARYASSIFTICPDGLATNRYSRFFISSPTVTVEVFPFCISIFRLTFFLPNNETEPLAAARALADASSAFSIVTPSAGVNVPDSDSVPSISKSFTTSESSGSV